MQAFALQKCIEDMGYEAGYLEYHPHTKLPFSKYILNRLNRILRSLLGYRQRRRKTKSFVDNYLNIESETFGAAGVDSKVDAERIDCDYYSYLKKGKPEFLGEYMSQYSWAEMTCGLLLDS